MVEISDEVLSWSGVCWDDGVGFRREQGAGRHARLEREEREAPGDTPGLSEGRRVPGGMPGLSEGRGAPGGRPGLSSGKRVSVGRPGTPFGVRGFRR